MSEKSFHLFSVGLNYPGTEYSLNGCHNDVETIKKTFYDPKNHKGIYCKMIDQTSKPTFENIKNEIAVIYSMIKAGDTFMFTFSGHGGQVKDSNRDESDGKDECIYDAEFNKILDDDLYKILVEPLPNGVNLVVVLDCCHSGTGLDLSWIYTPFKGETVESGKICSKKVYCISGCMDPQTSADAWIDRKSQGALTANLCSLYREICESNMNLRWCDFITLLRFKIATAGYEQVPVLSSSVCSYLESDFCL